MSKLIYFLLLTYFILIPFDGIVAFLSLKTGLEIILGWEILLSLFCLYLIVILYLGKGKFFAFSLSVTRGIAALIIYLMFFSIPIGIFDHGMWQTLWGIKLVLMPIVIFYLVFLIYPFSFKKFTENVIKIYFCLFIPIFIIGIWENYLGVSFLTDVLGIPYGERFLKISHIQGFYRTIATFRQPYDFGFFSFLISVFALCGLVIKPKNNRIWNLVFLILGLYSLFLSTTRTVILSFAYIIFILIFASIGIRFFKSKRATMFLLFLSSLVVILVIFLLSVRSIFVYNEFFLFSTTSIGERFIHWTDALKTFSLDNFFRLLLGYGIGAIGSAQLKINPIDYNPVDNMYIYLIINFGLIGTILLLLIMLNTLITAFSKIKTVDWIHTGFLLVIASMVFIQSFFVSYAEGLLSWGIFWLGILYLRYGILVEPPESPQKL